MNFFVGATEASRVFAALPGADIEAMVASNAIDLETAADRLAELLGDDPRVERLRTTTAP